MFNLNVVALTMLYIRDFHNASFFNFNLLCLFAFISIAINFSNSSWACALCLFIFQLFLLFFTAHTTSENFSLSSEIKFNVQLFHQIRHTTRITRRSSCWGKVNINIIIFNIFSMLLIKYSLFHVSHRYMLKNICWRRKKIYKEIFLAQWALDCVLMLWMAADVVALKSE